MDAGSLPRTNPPVVLLYNLGLLFFFSHVSSNGHGPLTAGVSRRYWQFDHESKVRLKELSHSLACPVRHLFIMWFYVDFYERINYDDDNDEIIGQSHVALNPKCIMTKQRRQVSNLH